ncbi:MAG: NADH-ubiquinone oxidoreductase-F iron-sulfur binding region domain-containing protein [Nitriliruptoraceae bacterium]
MPPGAIDLDDVQNHELEHRSRIVNRALVCTSTGCLSAGAAAVRARLEADLAASEDEHEAEVVATGCPGLCSKGPLVTVESRGGVSTMYEHVDEERAGAIARDHLLGNKVAEDAPVVPPEIPFYAKQHQVVLRNAGRIDPDRIEDYIAVGGYRALEKALKHLTPQEVIQAIDASGLRGRGGAGYPTARKWQLLHDAPGEQKYVVVNGDEGDPGAYMDRTIMDSDPHRLLEGIAIAAYATGANKAFVYVRAEYPLAIERLERAIRAAKKAKILGRSVLGHAMALDIEVRVGAGAFVCGEETALMASIEGRRGTPSLRPPYPTEKGLWGAPTMINNVETIANIAPIILDGPEAFASVGTETSKGTKVFALAGSVVNTGLIEVPMGISLREIVFDMAGGIPDGKAFKAAQTGGPSGGCIPAQFLDTPVDYEHLRELGSMMGSGGLVVMDETVRMPEVARFYMEFCRDESCGKCTPCRAGTVKMHEFLDRICEGVGRKRDLQHLESLCKTVRATSLCGLGQSAPNPVFSTLEHFREEYLELLVEDEVYRSNGHGPPDGAVPSTAAATSDGGAR